MEVTMKNSAVIYEGPSPINGAPIIAIASGLKTPSINDKTGDMIQIDILLRDIHPVEAMRSGEDVAICGECPLRSKECYVNVGFAQSSKWRAYRDGKVPFMSLDLFGKLIKRRGAPIRWGAYGDPSDLPFDLVELLLVGMGLDKLGWTSYTHQWMQPWFDKRHLKYSMASIDKNNTVEMLRDIYGDDVRYYRIADDYNNLAKDEIACPSSGDDRVYEEGPRTVTCNTCLLCAGTSKQAKNVVIVGV